MSNYNHYTHLELSKSLDTNSYKFDQYGNILVGTIDDLLFDKFIEKSEEKSNIDFNLNSPNNNSKIKTINSIISLSSKINNININSSNQDNFMKKIDNKDKNLIISFFILLHNNHY